MHMRLELGVTILCAVVFWNVSAYAGALKIKDGDSFVLPSGEEVRLWGIDAPELYQVCIRASLPYPCGEDAQLKLIEIVGHDKITCRRKTAGKFGRSISRCFVRGVDLGSMMVRSGYALDYYYFSGGYYHAEQDAARNENKGLWSGRFEKPWIWRRKNK